jgi:hypothetical protein
VFSLVHHPDGFLRPAVHPLQGGLFRRKYRTDRRPGLPLELRFVFYPRYAWEIVSKYARLLAVALRYERARRRVAAGSERFQLLRPRPRSCNSRRSWRS